MMNGELLQVVHEKDGWIDESATTIVPRRHKHDTAWPSIEEDIVTEMVDKKSRRKSWHAIKFDRKRRKSSAGPGSPKEGRQKRLSWWNIFAPPQWPR